MSFLQPLADRAQLSRAIITDTLAALPVPPERVSNVQEPVVLMHQVRTKFPASWRFCVHEACACMPALTYACIGGNALAVVCLAPCVM
jgi:hypothetical protein